MPKEKIEKILSDPITRIFGMLICLGSLCAEFFSMNGHGIQFMGYSGSGYWAFAAMGFFTTVANEIYAVRKYFVKK
jgi:hypothetical protein